jgi:hypothetical protein
MSKIESFQSSSKDRARMLMVETIGIYNRLKTIQNGPRKKECIQELREKLNQLKEYLAWFRVNCTSTVLFNQINNTVLKIEEFFHQEEIKKLG